eukprot:1161961-Pelagomonas_calceolata.AAC.3
MQEVSTASEEASLKNRADMYLELRTTTNWAVLRECGREPLQFYWFRSVVKMYNSMLRSNSETLRRVIKADVNIHSHEPACWTAQTVRYSFKC